MSFMDTYFSATENTDISKITPGNYDIELLLQSWWSYPGLYGLTRLLLGKGWQP